MILRPYQREAVAAANAMLERWQSATLHMVTASGKTVTAAHIVADQLAAGRRVLWMAHREELLAQARETLAKCGVAARIERGSKHAGDAPVVISTPGTMRNRDLGGFGLLVIDEGHRAAAPGYVRLRERYGVPALLLTATPARADGKDLNAEVAYRYTIRDGLRDGSLVRPVARRIRCAMRPELLEVKSGDYSPESVALCIHPGLPEFAAGTAEHMGDRLTMAFLPDVATSHAFAEVMRGLGVSAIAMDGKTPKKERPRIIEAFRRGEYRLLASCDLFLEGFDVPEVSCIAWGRVTKNATVFQQGIGRGLRAYPGQTDCLILDLVGVDCDLISENSLSAYGETSASVAATGGPVDIIAAIDAAEAEAAARARYVAEVEELELLEPAAQRGRQVRPEQLGIEWEPTPGLPTIADARRIVRAGIRPPNCTAEAAAVLAWLDGREGLATAKQARLLRRYGCRTDLPRDEADEAMAICARLGWRNDPRLRSALARWRADEEAA